MSVFPTEKISAFDGERKPCQQVAVGWTSERQSFFQTKYCIDLWLGRVLLVLFSPLIMALWLLVVLTSKGPGFYRQTRTGLNGRDFDVIKLRSMTWNAESSGAPVLCCKKDSRMTIVGKVLRLLHLDELPQLVNVARGEMALVGPRPERPVICEELAGEIEGYFDRVRVMPGITGLSQINLPPDSTWGDVRRKQALDLTYINEVNWHLEFRILAATAMRMFGVKGGKAMRVMALSQNRLLDEMGLAEEPDEEPLPFSQAYKTFVKLQEPEEKYESGDSVFVEMSTCSISNS